MKLFLALAAGISIGVAAAITLAARQQANGEPPAPVPPREESRPLLSDAPDGGAP